MKKRNLYLSLTLLAAFVLWTVAVSCIDVRPIGPLGSRVGFGALNGFVHDLIGVHMPLYVLTDWLGLVPVGVGLGFGLLGLAQWCKRKSIAKVDRSILVLGGFYILTVGAYLLFEEVVINYRPVLIQGVLEASYPSSTTLLVLCVMPTAALQLRRRIKRPTLRRVICAAIWAFVGFMVVARLVSGVHWLTDILGGILLSAALVGLYGATAG